MVRQRVASSGSWCAPFPAVPPFPEPVEGNIIKHLNDNSDINTIMRACQAIFSEATVSITLLALSDPELISGLFFVTSAGFSLLALSARELIPGLSVAVKSRHQSRSIPPHGAPSLKKNLQQAKICDMKLVASETNAKEEKRP